MDKNRIVGSPKEIKSEAQESIGDAKLKAGGKSDQAEDKAPNDVGGVNDAVRDALTTSAVAMTLGGMH
jgi:uncharacterized protein YjbJ (UPF0337 family)